MTDRDLIHAAIDTTGLSANAFAPRVLGVDPSTLRRWLVSDGRSARAMPEPTRRLLRLLVAHPRLWRELDTA